MLSEAVVKEKKTAPQPTDRQRLSRCLEMLPEALGREIRALLHQDKEGYVSEICFKAGVSSLTLSGRRIPLVYRGCREDVERALASMCGGAVYAHRDTLAQGYITLDGGTRVGVIGCARYENGRIVGAAEPDALVIRLPSGRCDFADELAELWYRRRPRGLLIVSPPGGGKTTALRALAYRLGTGRSPLRIVAVDERREFDSQDYDDTTVELLRGYRRRDGIEAAVRYTAPDLLMVDEIGAEEDAAAMELCLGVGVDVVATAHGATVADALGRRYISELARCGCFDLAVPIVREGSVFRLGEAEELTCL